MSEKRKEVRPLRIFALILMMLIIAAGIYFVVRFAMMRSRIASLPTVDVLIPTADQPVTSDTLNPVRVFASGNGQGISALEWYLDGILAGRLEGDEEILAADWEWMPDQEGTYHHTFLAYAKNGGMGMTTLQVAAIAGADIDGDGVPDQLDECPDEAGPEASNGCVISGDNDGDGLAGEEDACPDAPGTRESSGCPGDRAPDRDADGITDAVDHCPENPGRPDWDGCPLSAWAINTDGDELPDFLDDCPSEYGPRESHGCPLPGGTDRDGDGMADADDECADSPGTPLSSGCPLVDDRDGDGVSDDRDECPDEAGLPATNGCPTADTTIDADLDGIPDAIDGCPDLPGLMEYGGCPMPDDRDGDGVADMEDYCTDLPGSPGTFGCPMVSFPFFEYNSQFKFLPNLPILGEKSPEEILAYQPELTASIFGSKYIPQPDDQDGDGVLDEEDECDNQVGRPLNNGCPFTGDRDSDNIPDASDTCSEFNGSCQDPSDISKIQIELVNFRYDPYFAGVYCYGWTNGYDNYLRIPEWNYLGYLLEYYSGRIHLDTRFIPSNSYISLELHCWGQPEDLTMHSQYLGGMRLDYHYFFWDGQVRKVRAYGPGGMFEVWLKIRQLSYAIT